MAFKVVCIKCWEMTKYDALEDTRGLPCDKCGELL